MTMRYAEISSINAEDKKEETYMDGIIFLMKDWVSKQPDSISAWDQLASFAADEAVRIINMVIIK